MTEIRDVEASIVFSESDDGRPGKGVLLASGRAVLLADETSHIVEAAPGESIEATPTDVGFVSIVVTGLDGQPIAIGEWQPTAPGHLVRII
ncbi:MAG: hypothetical protein AAGA90_21750 [Actinomycetota bacterium]